MDDRVAVVSPRRTARRGRGEPSRTGSLALPARSGAVSFTKRASQAYRR